jgi:hypothetical protein
MKYGYYSDNQIPESVAKDRKPISEYKTNSHGYRCPEWTPMPDGKKNVVVLGCSHTFGEGLDDGEVWVERLYNKMDQKKLRFWNLGQPGASADKVVRILYGTEKVINPQIIIICWPFWSRRERLDHYANSLMSYDPLLKSENEHTDKNNFLKNVFFAEKFAEQNNAKLFHCFAQDVYDIPKMDDTRIFLDTTIKLCWPYWDKTRKWNVEERQFTEEPSLAKDGLHYGIEHHERFAELLFRKWKSKLN